MVTTLVGSREHAVVLGNDVIFQFTHCLECHPGGCSESLCGTVQRLFRRTVQRLSFLIEIRTKHAKGRNLGKRVHECRAETGNDIQVAVAGFDK